MVTDRRAAERRFLLWARATYGPPPEPAPVDYDAMGFTLGIPERRAAGLALRERR